VQETVEGVNKDKYEVVESFWGFNHFKYIVRFRTFIYLYISVILDGIGFRGVVLCGCLWCWVNFLVMITDATGYE
jgi:hypothetical protein